MKLKGQFIAIVSSYIILLFSMYNFRFSSDLHFFGIILLQVVGTYFFLKKDNVFVLLFSATFIFFFCDLDWLAFHLSRTIMFEKLVVLSLPLTFVGAFITFNEKKKESIISQG